MPQKRKKIKSISNFESYETKKNQVIFNSIVLALKQFRFQRSERALL